MLLPLVSIHINGQILDVPYRSDNGGCGVWCWAKSSQMVAIYYGNDILLCDVLEFVRLSKPTFYDTYNCCDEIDSCCSSGYFYMSGSYPNSCNQILDNWSISNTNVGSYLSVSQIQTELTNNKPFLILQAKYNPGAAVGYHVTVAYGYSSGDLYLHDPGNGSKIMDYTEYLSYGTDNVKWIQTLLMNSGASTCPLTQHIIGRIKKSEDEGNVYKAQQDIYASCIIEPTASIEFECGDDIILEQGFRVDVGRSVIFRPGSTIICP